MKRDLHPNRCMQDFLKQFSLSVCPRAAYLDIQINKKINYCFNFELTKHYSRTFINTTVDADINIDYSCS